MRIVVGKTWLLYGQAKQERIDSMKKLTIALIATLTLTGCSGFSEAVSAGYEDARSKEPEVVESVPEESVESKELSLEEALASAPSRSEVVRVTVNQNLGDGEGDVIALVYCEYTGRVIASTYNFLAQDVNLIMEAAQGFDNIAEVTVFIDDADENLLLKVGYEHSALYAKRFGTYLDHENHAQQFQQSPLFD